MPFALPPALRHRRYRLLWLGMLISVAGTQMQIAAILWHVNELSGEPIALGGVGLARIAPVLIFSLLAGALADTWNRRRLMLLTQTTLALLAALLAWITRTGHDTVWVIYAITAVTAGVTAFDLPARQSLIPNLVPREHLTNAFSLGSIAFQTGAIVGPALGGLVLARLGLDWAYWINALSYVAVIIALLMMGPVHQEAQPAASGGVSLAAVAEGVRFIRGQPIVLSSMLLDFFATFFSSATALLPIFAKEILGVGPLGYGWLVSAQSVGAVCAATVISIRGQILGQGKVLLRAVTVFGLATIVFGLSRSYWLTFGALTVAGAADSVSTILRNTIRQLQTPDRLRGRMVSVNQMFFMGGPQLGELEAGLVAQLFGAPFSVVSGGVGCLLAVAWVIRRWPSLQRYRGDEPALAT
ncbi:MAG TPA: MFS transporter [Anaerolineales bacterium]|nr:MFS transporter [Anaerolineales bacterium]